MFGMIAGGVSPGRGRKRKNWAQCLADYISVFKATEGSTDSSPWLFGVDTVLLRAAMKSGNWYRGLVGATDRFMTRWHRSEAEKNWLRRAPVDAKKSNKGKPGVGCRTDAAVDECRNEMVDRLARYPFD